ncbi:helix-turn-helix domain-containing protein [Streptomyces sp. NPDC056488]|uniref:helix-turn-helix domain-containing protein n=1 Tax=unclassified Streptomyces TaxID=2593676 RepID=UPI0036C1574E
MTEVARTRGGSAEVERGGIAEVAALGNELTGLFTRLGITQSQYAYRVHLDKSAVSRYLSGRRLAPQEFVDRLVREVEEHVGAPLRLEVKEAIRGRRLEALRACNPAEYELETLRGELARSRRDAERVNRTIEALHVLLEHKESEVRAVADDLTRLRLDWGAERVALARSQEELRSEITRLREDLADAERLRLGAERRGEELRGTVLRLEEELARRPAGGVGELPLEEFKRQIVAMTEDEDFPEAARELTEASWSRPLDEVAELLRWLRQDDIGATTVEMFAANVARLRPLEDVLAFAPEVTGWGGTGIRSAWRSVVAARITERNAAAVYLGLRDDQTLSDSEADRVLAQALLRVRSDTEAVSLLTAALVGTAHPARLTRVTTVLVHERRSDPLGLGVLLGLAERGRFDMAAALLAAVVAEGPVRTGYGDDESQLGRRIREFDGERIGVLLDLVTWLDDTEVITLFATRLAHADEPALLDRLFTTMAEQGRLSLLHLGVSARLRRAVSDWRRSRRQ